MIENQYNYSFIIPHKNIPELLSRCIKSIPCRSDIQVIIIDDNSDEQIVDFNCFPGIDMPNVEVIFLKETLGAGHARNIGLSKAKGKWILFADADDFFNFNLLERLDFYCKENNDIIFFKVNSMDSIYYTNSNRGMYVNNYIDLSKKNREKSVNLLRYKFGEPWAKMIKKELIDKYSIKFDEIIVHNDTTFSLLVGHYAQNIAIDNHAIYCVTTRKNSISYAFTDSKLLVRIDVFSKVDCFYTEHRIPLSKIKRHFISSIHFLLYNKKLFREGFSMMEKNGLSKTYIWMNLIFNIPLYIAYRNRNFIYKFLPLIER